MAEKKMKSAASKKRPGSSRSSRAASRASDTKPSTGKSKKSGKSKSGTARTRSSSSQPAPGKASRANSSSTKKTSTAGRSSSSQSKQRKRSGNKSGSKSRRAKSAGAALEGAGGAVAEGERRPPDMLDPPAMHNLYYIAHAAPDALDMRGFRWPSAGAARGKKKRGKKRKK